MGDELQLVAGGVQRACDGAPGRIRARALKPSERRLSAAKTCRKLGLRQSRRPPRLANHICHEEIITQMD